MQKRQDKNLKKTADNLRLLQKGNVGEGPNLRQEQSNDPTPKHHNVHALLQIIQPLFDFLTQHDHQMLQEACH